MRSLFSGPAVQRTPELQFQRPAAEIELSAADAKRLGVGNGDPVAVAAGGATLTLAARINRRLVSGAARVAEEHVRDLAGDTAVVTAAAPAAASAAGGGA